MLYFVFVTFNMLVELILVHVVYCGYLCGIFMGKTLMVSLVKFNFDIISEDVCAAVLFQKTSH